ncbi:MAG: anti-sigma factor family protein [Ardenticatenaceae bacterium]
MSEYEQNMEAQWQHLQKQLAGASVPNTPSTLRQAQGASSGRVPQEVLHLVRVVAGVEDLGMTCEACEGSLLAYVDDEIGGLDVARLYPDVKRHLDLCPDCMKEYVEMLEWGLAEDAAWQPVDVPIPTPDLSFLPPLAPALPKVSFPDYVRSVAEQLISALLPKRIGRFQKIADEFFERIARKSFQPATVLSSKPKPKPMHFLAAAYATTQTLVEEWSISEVETAMRDGTLLERVREQAEKEARKQGFRKKDAQRFAKQYAEIVCEDPVQLKGLLSR